MAPYTSVANALTAIKTDESKVLGLTVGDKKVTPGLKIPKAGPYNHLSKPMRSKYRTNDVY